MLRSEPLAYLPALLALALAAVAVPARAEARLISLCSGSSLPAPGIPSRDCDQACLLAAAEKSAVQAGSDGAGVAPARSAMRAVKAIFSASDNDPTPSFDIRLARWISTVRGEMPRS